MRWVFYSLLVVNLVYFGWQLTMSLLSAPAEAPRRIAPELEGAPLVLLEEASRLQPRRRQPPRQQRLCAVLGPWSEQSEAQAGLVQLEAAGIGGRVRGVPVEKDRLNWVYLPPYQSRDRALRVLRDLQDHGVDSFIVKEGEDANAISLGYFSSPESAEGLRVKMRSLGYPAFVKETARQVTEYWIYLAEAEALDHPDLQAFLDGNPGIAADKAACESPGGQ